MRAGFGWIFVRTRGWFLRGEWWVGGVGLALLRPERVICFWYFLALLATVRGWALFLSQVVGVDAGLLLLRPERLYVCYFLYHY